MRAALCAESSELARRRENARELILHSDRGSQYTSRMFQTALKKRGVVQNMSGTSRYYNNVRKESYFYHTEK